MNNMKPILNKEMILEFIEKQKELNTPTMSNMIENAKQVGRLQMLNELLELAEKSI